MSITTSVYERSAAYSYGGVHTVQDREMGGGRRWRAFDGVVRSPDGIIHITGDERTGGDVPDVQVWYFSIVDPNRATEISRREERTRRDFLTLAGAKRVALRWVRELVWK